MRRVRRWHGGKLALSVSRQGRWLWELPQAGSGASAPFTLWNVLISECFGPREGYRGFG